MGLIRKLKLEEQRADGIALYSEKTKKEETITEILSAKKPQKDTDCGPVDGHWVTLSDWSQCSLKCGGGVSTLQRQCIQPKNGGKNCEGDAILTRKCNTQPCPDLGGKNSTFAQSTIKKPVIKALKFSNMPQRYVKCKIKEGDLMLYQNITEASNEINIKNLLASKIDLEGMTEINIPVRVVMNNETFSIYTGDTFDSIIISFKLKMSIILRHAVRQDCFVVKETDKKKITLCQFTCNGPAKEVEEWDYDFNLFKHQCAVKPEKYIDVSKELKLKLQYKIVSIFLI